MEIKTEDQAEESSSIIVGADTATDEMTDIEKEKMIDEILELQEEYSRLEEENRELKIKNERLNKERARLIKRRNHLLQLHKVAPKIYPNDPCPCGSGKKYKKCCGKN